MTDQLSILKLVTERLDAAGVAYMLTGSIAAGYYAQPRMTRDIDVGTAAAVQDAQHPGRPSRYASTLRTYATMSCVAA